MPGYDKFGLPTVVMKGAAEGYDPLSQAKSKIDSQKTKTLDDGIKVTEYYDKNGNLLLTKTVSQNGGPSIFKVPVKTEYARQLWTFMDDDQDGNIDFISNQDFNEGYSEWYRSSEDNGWFDLHGRSEMPGAKLKKAGKVIKAVKNESKLNIKG